jgi:HlyD family secretion protein
VDTPILKMGNTAQMHAVAEVYETDIRFVREGQRASVRSPALASALTGKVVKIGNLIYKNDVLDVDPAANTDRRVVEVRIALDDGGEAARLTNLTVDVVIDVTGARGAPEAARR